MKKLLVLGMMLAGEAQAAGPFSWATTGSTGTVDEDSTSLVQFNGPYVTFRTSCLAVIVGGISCEVSRGTVTVRYRVGRLNNAPAFSLTTRFRDGGKNQRVQLFVKGVDLTSGTESIVFTFDSDTFSPSSDYQTQVTSACPLQLDFDRHTYYVEAVITNSRAGSSPGLETIDIRGCSTL